MVAQPNSLTILMMLPHSNDAGPGGAFKLPLPPSPPAEERKSEQGE